MKIILILLLTSYFIGCKKSANKSGSTKNQMSWLKASYAKNEPTFTITHRGLGGKDVFVFLQKSTAKGERLRKLLDHENPPPYRLKPYECLQVTQGQINHLVVMEELPDKLKDAGLKTNKILCGNAIQHKCQPTHYQVINNVFFDESYILNPVSYPNQSDNCPHIVDWMIMKNPLGVGDDEETEDGLPANNEPLFTITHKATDLESVFVTLQEEKVEEGFFFTTGVSSYQLNPNECLKLKKSHFDNLVLSAGRGLISWRFQVLGGSMHHKILCGNTPEDKCKPQHYEIVDESPLWDNYIIKPVNKTSINKNCFDIEHWMQFRTTKTIKV